MPRPITRAIYDRALDHFWTWARLAHQLDEHYPVDPVLLLDFLTQQLRCPDPELDRRLVAAGAKREPGPLALATLKIRFAALDRAHTERNFEPPSRDPLVIVHVQRAAAWDRQITRPAPGPRDKLPITTAVLEQFLAACDDTPDGLQDRALLLTGHAAGGPRITTELAGLRLEHLLPGPEPGVYRWTATGTLLRDRTAQALRRWLEHLVTRGLTSGYIFRGLTARGKLLSTDPELQISTNTITRRIQRRATAAGLDGRLYGGSSLRGGVTGKTRPKKG